MSIQYIISTEPGEDSINLSIGLYPEHLVDLLGDLAYIEELELQGTGAFWKALRTDLGKVELELKRDLSNVPYLKFVSTQIVGIS